MRRQDPRARARTTLTAIATGAATAATTILAARAAAQPPPAPPPAVLYLNFSDGTLALGHAEIDDAPANLTRHPTIARYPAFSWPDGGDAALRQDVIHEAALRVHQAFLPYNVVVTVTRPAAGPYTMIMVGDRPQEIAADARAVGTAAIDCGNAHPSDVGFSFADALAPSARALWLNLAHEAAHTFGLEHTTLAADIMHPALGFAQSGFIDADGGSPDGSRCGRVTQNSHRELLAALGPWSGGEKPFDGGPGRLRPATGGCGITGSHPDAASSLSLGALAAIFGLTRRHLARWRKGDYKTPPAQGAAMPKKGIHPVYQPSTISCACGNKVETYSTRGSFMVDICAACHPFYTGKQKFVDTGGRIERFQKRYQKKTAPAAS